MPIFEINLKKVKENYLIMKEELPNAIIAYALKANYDKKILKTLKDLGCSAEVCSDYELGIAKRIGFKKIIRNGYGKGNAWLRNVEVIEDRANTKGLIGARLRLSEKSKLGISEKEILSQKWDCIAIHTRNEFKKSLNKAIRIGKKVGAKYIDAGGGISPERIKLLKKVNNLIIEPGRDLVENACRAISKVLAVKGKKVIIDCGMNFLNKFSNSKFKVTAPGKKDHGYKVYGPIPTDIDNIGNHNLPRLKRGDEVVIENAGAYTLSMASNWTQRIPKIKYIK
jgi:diaminopimelate decarboxylase